MTNKYLSYTIGIILLCTSLWSAAQNEIGFPFIRNYTAKEYDNAPQVWCVKQNSKGLMYFGMASGGGIVEYDSRKWTVIDIPNKTSVYSIDITANDVVYAGAKNDFGYLQVTQQGKKVFTSLATLIQQKDVKFGSVWQTKAVGDKVYFLSSEYIFEYTSAPTPQIRTLLVQTGNRFVTLFEHQGKVYALQNKTGIMLIEPDSLRLATDFYKNKIFRAALSFSPDTVLVTTRGDGLYYYQPASNVSTEFVIEQKDFLADNDVYFSTLLPNRNIALASTDRGLLLVSPQGKTLQTWNEHSLLQTNTIRYIFNSSDNNLWFGLENGISRSVASTAWTYWDKNVGLKGNVTDILRFGGKLYVSTYNAIYYLHNNVPEEVKGVEAGQCWDLYVYTTPKNEKILLAGTQTGIYQIKGNQATMIHDGSHAHDFYVSAANPNRVFTTDSPTFMSLLYQNGKWIEEDSWEGIKDNIYEIQEDKNGELWLGTANSGLIRVTPNADSITKPKKVRYYTEKNGLPSLRSVFPYFIKGNLVFATEKGLYAHNPQTDSIQPYCDVDTTLCNGNQDIFRIYETAQGNIWFLPSRNKHQDAGYLQPNAGGTFQRIYKPFRSLPQMDMECFYADSNGVAWIGGTEGLFRYDPKADVKNYDADFYTLIRKVTIGIDSVVYYGALDTNLTGFKNLSGFDYEHNSLKFEFAAPFFDDETKNLYSYQLQGFDNDWSAWTTISEKEYTNLHEGSYTFMVKAQNLYDKQSIVATYPVKILPPWYRTWWAYTLYVVFFLGLGVIILKFYTRRLVAQKEHLEKIVTQRTAEVVKQKQEIEQKSIILEQQKEEIQAIAENLQEANTSITEKNITLQQQKEEIQTIAENLQEANNQITSKNEALESKNAEIQEKNVVLQQQHEQITSSIRYAQKIQRAILPIKTQIDGYFENFILYRPKDIVSGDFYWFTVLDEGDKKMFFAAVVDCTGHGVPGAFMSMIGSRLLSEIVNERRTYETNEILEALDNLIFKSLQQQESDNNDGMDLSVCRIIPTSDGYDIQFTGAKNVGYYVDRHANELITLEADRRAIGGIRSRKKDHSFSAHTYKLLKGDTLYLFSDGFIDQNNPDRKRMGSLFFKQLIIDNHRLPMQQQQTIFEQALDQYRQHEEQRDDITVLGLRMI